MTAGAAAMRHFVLPDVQAKPGVSFTYLNNIGKYIVEKKPDKIVCLGDFADMSSLSSYDKGTKKFEGQRYLNDILSAKAAMAMFLAPLSEFNLKAKKSGKKQYKPELHMLLGNHEHRIDRAVNEDPKLDGILSVKDLKYEEFGWTVHPFLEVVVLDGIAYSHYFVTGVAGRPASSAAVQLRKTNMSCIAGHQQGKQIAYGTRADGKTITSIIAGSCYEHNEDYMGPQGNKHWRGALMLHEVDDGAFDEMWLSIRYFNERQHKT